jgi:hypothetical protein
MHGATMHGATMHGATIKKVTNTTQLFTIILKKLK